MKGCTWNATLVSLSLLALLPLGACSRSYSKPDLTMAEWHRDNFACEGAAEGVGSAPPIYAPNPQAGWVGVAQQGNALFNASQGLFRVVQQNRLYRLCMQARGYTPD